jgi:16S rRNA (cytosine1402-N4)-methyltransferase
MERSDYHIPVMLEEVLQMIAVNPIGAYADGTLGGGGHAEGLLARLDPAGMLYGFDADPGAIAHASTRLSEAITAGRLIVRQGYFTEACAMLIDDGVKLSGVLLDLGVSSRQLDSDQIGLSYRVEMDLDMRFRREADRPSARDLVNNSSPEDLATLLRRYGEEPAAWKIANAIVRVRKGRTIATTVDLREAIVDVIPPPFQTKTLARVFQALRIAVNDELGELERGLDGFIPLLELGGRFVVLTYHSLEDRIVKTKFRDEARSCTCPPGFPVCRCDTVQRLRVLTRKALLPTQEEIERNPRSRSARLRVAERVEAIPKNRDVGRSRNQ